MPRSDPDTRPAPEKVSAKKTADATPRYIRQLGTNGYQVTKSGLRFRENLYWNER